MLEIIVKTQEELYQEQIDEAVAQAIAFMVKVLPNLPNFDWESFYDNIPDRIHERISELLEDD